MNRKNDQTVAQQAAEVVDDVADGARSAVHGARKAVEETYEEAGQFARDSADHSLAKARSWESSLERRVRENPKTSLFLAAALGGLIVAWWKRR